jgi:hypothetical protein
MAELDGTNKMRIYSIQASSSKAIPRNLNLFSRSQPHKMIFVVNTSLKMGAGKMAAQVAHASVALYKLCQSSQEVTLKFGELRTR